MKEAKLQYSIKVPSGYDKVIEKARKYLFEHPGTIRKRPGNLIFISDVFQWALDMLADHLDINFRNNEDIEIVGEEELERKQQNKRLAIILSEKYYDLQEEYLDKFVDKMSLFEFCDLKDLDWKSLLRSTSTNK